jgi:hypothetical protein
MPTTHKSPCTQGDSGLGVILSFAHTNNKHLLHHNLFHWSFPYAQNQPTITLKQVLPPGCVMFITCSVLNRLFSLNPTKNTIIRMEPRVWHHWSQQQPQCDSTTHTFILSCVTCRPHCYNLIPHPLSHVLVSKINLTPTTLSLDLDSSWQTQGEAVLQKKLSQFVIMLNKILFQLRVDGGSYTLTL